MKEVKWGEKHALCEEFMDLFFCGIEGAVGPRFWFFD